MSNKFLKVMYYIILLFLKVWRVKIEAATIYFGPLRNLIIWEINGA